MTIKQTTSIGWFLSFFFSNRDTSMVLNRKQQNLHSKTTKRKHSTVMPVSKWLKRKRCQHMNLKLLITKSNVFSLKGRNSSSARIHCTGMSLCLLRFWRRNKSKFRLIVLSHKQRNPTLMQLLTKNINFLWFWNVEWELLLTASTCY